MSFYQTALVDRLVGASASSSPGAGWTLVSDFPTLLNNARTSNTPLFLLPGLYVTSQIDINSSAGSGYPLTVRATIGSVVVELAGTAPYLMSVNGISNVTIDGLIFDGNNIALNDTSEIAALIHFTNAGGFTIQNCSVRNTNKAGIACDSNASGNILINQIYSCDIGIFCLDANVNIVNNVVSYCADTGMHVWTSNINGNSSVVQDNIVSNISNASGGTGQYGNGIVVFRAVGVRVVNNSVSACALSAIRLNSAGGCHVEGNLCYNVNENAIWFEAPGAGLNLDGGVCANNIIIGAGSGIALVNSGLNNDGVSRRVTVSGNQISNITVNYLSGEGYTTGAGIIAEGSCNLIGNSLENIATFGLILGTNNGATDLTAVGNFIHTAPCAIGYSANSSAVGILISSNNISGYLNITNPSDPNYGMSGAIVSVSLTSNYFRDAPGGAANIDYGNATQTVVGPLTVGMNKAH